MTRGTTSLDFSQTKVLTFDCYGTLIDWERGILAALQPLLARAISPPDDEELLRLYAQFEMEEERPPYRRYREVLRSVAERFGRHLGIDVTLEEKEAFAESVKRWPPFDETVAALQALQRRYRLVVLSNIDDDLFGDTARLLQVPFDLVITAEQVRSYKPGFAHFERALAALALDKSEIVHVGQSLFHDIAPTRDLGIRNVWVNRRGKRGGGAAADAAVRPDLEVASLKDLVELSAAG
jgi:2-haloacid dehalogenase